MTLNFRFDALLEHTALGSALDIAIDVTDNNVSDTIKDVDDLNKSIEDTLTQIDVLRSDTNKKDK